MIRKPKRQTVKCRRCEGQGFINQKESFALMTEAEQDKQWGDKFGGIKDIEGAPKDAERCYAGLGSTIHEAIREGISLAQRMDKPVAFSFNDQTVVCYAGSDFEVLLRKWWKAAYNETPEESFARR